MKRHTLIFSGQQGRPRKKRLQTVQVSPRQWVSPPMKAEKHPACQDPCCAGGTFGRRQHWQGRGHQEWRPQWNQGHDWGIHSVPFPGSEGGSARGDMLLPLQQSGAFHPQLPAGEGIQNWYTFKLKGGDGAKEGSPCPSRKGDHAKGTQGRDAQCMGNHAQTPFLNPNPFYQWYRIENVARVRVNGESCMAPLDNGAQINTIMPGFVENHSLDVGPLSDLVGRWVACVGLGNALTWPMGHIIIWV